MAPLGQPLPFTGDVNLFGKPHTIDDAAVRKLRNLVTDGMGNLKRRGAMTFQSVIRSAGFVRRAYLDDGSDVNVGATTGIIWFAILKPGIYVALHSADGTRSELLFMTDDATPASAFTSYAYSVNWQMTSPSHLPQVIWDGDVAYILNGFNEHSISGGALGSGTAFWKVEFPVETYVNPGGFTTPFKVTPASFNHESNIAVTPKLAVICRQRGWFANVGRDGSKPGTVLVSDIDDILTIGENAVTDRNFIIGDGKVPFTGFKMILLQGGGDPSTSAIVALKRYGAWVITGEPTETDDADYFGTLDIKEVSTKAGCISQNSICSTDWGTIWCGPDDVWLMPYGSVPIPIGKKIRPLLLAQPRSQEFRIHAAVHGGFYRLCLFSEGQGPGATDPLGEQWWLDLNEGPPTDWASARWVGPMVYNPQAQFASARLDEAGNEPATSGVLAAGTSFIAKDETNASDDQLYGIELAQAGEGEGSASHNDASPPFTLGLTLVTYDAPNSRDVAGLFRPGLVPWVANTAYQVGEEVVVMEFNGDLHPSLYVVGEVTGTRLSGGTEPAWLTAGFAGIVDNEVTWIKRGYVLSPVGAFGSEIDVEYKSKEYAPGGKMVDKLWLGAELSVVSGTAQAIQVEQLVDSGKIRERITVGVDRMEGPHIGDSATFINAIPNFSEEAQAVRAFSGEDTRTVGKTNQLAIRDSLGIYLPVLSFGVQVSGIGDPFVVTLTDSYYSNMLALATAMADAMMNDTGIAGLLGTVSVTTDENYAKVGINTTGSRWLPVPYSANEFDIWSMLGFPYDTGRALENLHVSDELPYDIQIGDLAISEATMMFRPRTRRVP